MHTDHDLLQRFETLTSMETLKDVAPIQMGNVGEGSHPVNSLKKRGRRVTLVFLFYMVKMLYLCCIRLLLYLFTGNTVWLL